MADTISLADMARWAAMPQSQNIEDRRKVPWDAAADARAQWTRLMNDLLSPPRAPQPLPPGTALARDVGYDDTGRR